MSRDGNFRFDIAGAPDRQEPQDQWAGVYPTFSGGWWQHDHAETTLERDGVLLAKRHPAVGTYAMAARTASLLFVSGHGAFDNGNPIHTGRLGEQLSTAEGTVAAETVMLNLLATVKAEVGALSRVAARFAVEIQAVVELAA